MRLIKMLPLVLNGQHNSKYFVRTQVLNFFTSPYSKAMVDHIDPFASAYKIGSGV